jgi:hypothetical protein
VKIVLELLLSPRYAAQPAVKQKLPPFVSVPPITLEASNQYYQNTPTYFRAGYIATSPGAPLMIWFALPCYFNLGDALAKILVIDDESGIRNLLDMLLRLKGMELFRREGPMSLFLI